MIALVGCVGGSARAPDARVDAAREVRGAARVEWQIVDGARDPCSCDEVGAGVVDVIARGPGPIYEDHFECLQSLAVTAPLAAGRYAFELRLETDDGVALGSARTAGVVGGELVDLGAIEIEVGALGMGD